jgi:predicted secreted protein
LWPLKRHNQSVRRTGSSPHFERWATIFQPPDEEEMLLFDKPVAEG